MTDDLEALIEESATDEQHDDETEQSLSDAIDCVVTVVSQWTYRDVGCAVLDVFGAEYLGYAKIDDEWERVAEAGANVDVEDVEMMIEHEVISALHPRNFDEEKSDLTGFGDIPQYEIDERDLTSVNPTIPRTHTSSVDASSDPRLY